MRGRHILFAALASIAWVGGVAAEPSDQQRAAVAAAWEQVRIDHRHVLTCSALEPEMASLLANGHVRGLELAAEQMRAVGFSEAEIVAEVAATQVDVLRAPADTSFAELIAFCAERPTWLRESQRVMIFPVDFAIERALAGE